MNADHKRYPRLPGIAVAGLALIAWEGRELSVKPNGDYTDILLRIPVPHKFDLLIPGAWGALSPENSDDWIRQIRAAIDSGNYGGKSLERQIGNAVYPAYAETVRTLLKSVRADFKKDEYVKHFEEAFEEYERVTRRTTGHQKSFTYAARLAQTYRKRLLLVKAALKIIRSWRKASDEYSLDRAIDKLVSVRLFRQALAKLTEKPEDKLRLTNPIIGVTARDITLHMIRCELQPPAPSIKTIAAHIRWANPFVRELPDTAQI